MALRLTGPHIQASGYRRGRDRKRWPENRITFLVLHTAEGATDEIDLGHFFANLGTASSNAGIGQDGGYASYVRYRDTPWTNPPIHDDTETLEICGFAGWSRKTWLDHKKMLETVAHWIAWRSAINGIPIRRIEGDRLRNGVKGIVDHDGINDVFHESDHWDIGENFPWDVVLPRARTIRKNRGAEEEDMTVEVVLDALETERGQKALAKAVKSQSGAIAGKVLWGDLFPKDPDRKGNLRNMVVGGVNREQVILRLLRDQHELMEKVAKGQADDATWTNLRNRTEQIIRELKSTEERLMAEEEPATE